MSTFGLDIGSNTIKIVQVAKEKNTFRLLSAGIAKSPPVDLNTAVEKDLLLLAEAIKKLKSETRISTNLVVASIPERDIFSSIIELPKMKDSELEQIIPFEAENQIPRPLEEVNLDWEVIESKEALKRDKILVHIVAASKFLVEKYIKLLRLAGLEPFDIETEMLAIIRCLKVIYEKNCILVVNFGSKSLELAFVKEGNLLSIRSLPTSGEAISRAVGVSLGLDFPVAEEYKKTYGLTNQLEGKIAEAIEPILSSLINEVKKTIKFHQEKNSEQAKLVVITGGSGLMPGMAEYLAKSLSLETQIADPLSIFPLTQNINEVYRKNSPIFTVALGLAMKNL